MSYTAEQFARGAGILPEGAHGFVSPTDRARLTPAAVAAMRQLTDAWQLSRREAAALVGVPQADWVRICCGVWTGPLSQDHLTRVMAARGVFDALHALFDDDTADRWLRLANNGPVFRDRAPLDMMIDEGIPGMIDVRRYLDGLRSGF